MDGAPLKIDGVKLAIMQKRFEGVLRFRSGAGSRPASATMRLMVFRPTSWPRLKSAPRMRE